MASEATKSELYSEERLVRCLEAARAKHPRGIVDRVMDDVVAFAGDAEQADDITIVNIEFLGPDRPAASSGTKTAAR